ncbi:FHA domain-containing protein, partial [Mycobacterium sp. 1245852.3]|uniref:FHA domain-containing protein n=1 Tax=Mycobacterium sp. 1245852.3 TaxID=1856860 RepID=UPI000A75580E
MPTEASALPASLTVWAGPTRYVFTPGRDVIVGYGPGCDIPLERHGNPPQPPPAPRVDVIVRFTGTAWVAIDLSRRGIFVNGSRVPTVEIRDGLAISIEDPQRGPRLVFHTAAPAAPPGQPPPGGPAHSPPNAPPPVPPGAPPGGPNEPDPRVPTQSATRRMPVVAPPPPPLTAITNANMTAVQRAAARPYTVI